jgi:hypothetical protein
MKIFKPCSKLNWLFLSISGAGTTEKGGIVHLATEVPSSTSLILNRKERLPEEFLQ